MFITQALSFYNFYNLLKRFELNWFSALVNLEQVGARSQIFGALFTALTWPKLKISLIFPTASAPLLPQPQSLSLMSCPLLLCCTYSQPQVAHRLTHLHLSQLPLPQLPLPQLPSPLPLSQRLPHSASLPLSLSFYYFSFWQRKYYIEREEEYELMVWDRCRGEGR